MPNLAVSIGIGLANARQEDVIFINDNEWNDCETQEDRDDLCQQYWQDWSNNLIDGSFEIID